MNTGTTEYTPGQLIRFEAISLYHGALRLQEIAARVDLVREPAERVRESIRLGANGEFTGINRREKHYEGLMDLLEQTREQLGKIPVSNETQEAWLLMNRCRYHCTTILGMMQKQARATGASS